MIKIRVGGVPEHFNLPWHLAIENGHFEREGLEVTWTDYKGGTGIMAKALEDDEQDVCLVLTEGIVAHIAKGGKAKIISKYTNTPLIWGVHTGKYNPIKYYGEIYDKKYAISRPGSGSHLMPMVDAFSKGFKLNESQMVVVQNLDGALESLGKNETDAFYWEKFTTKPYVDKGMLRFLGEYITPWPCFMIAASEKMIANHSEELKKMLQVIYFVNQQFMRSVFSVEMVSDRYGISVDDARQWFHNTEWATNTRVTEKMLDNVQFTLMQTGIIQSRKAFEDIYTDIYKFL
jgi:sulfonate transport system substrate-binding protein